MGKVNRVKAMVGALRQACEACMGCLGLFVIPCSASPTTPYMLSCHHLACFFLSHSLLSEQIEYVFNDHHLSFFHISILFPFSFQAHTD